MELKTISKKLKVKDSLKFLLLEQPVIWYTKRKSET